MGRGSLGAIGMLDPMDITGWGVELSSFAAAGPQGMSGQYSGSAPWALTGATGSGGGYAAGLGIGVSAMVTYTWYQGYFSVFTLPSNIQDAFAPYFYTPYPGP
jgi:hypothetical protein